MLIARRTFSLAIPALLLLAGSDLSAQSIVGTGAPAGTTSFVLDAAGAVSGDGTVVYGYASDGHAYFWTVAHGFTDLGMPAGQNTLRPSGVSADGRSFTGRSYGANGTRAYRWTVEGGFQDIGRLPGGTFSYGNAISAYGNVVVGQANDGTTNYRAYRWSGGVMMQLPYISGSLGSAQAWGTNADGSIVVGEDYIGGASSGYRGFRWTASGGSQILTPLPGYRFSRAYCVSADGTVIAGNSNAVSFSTPVYPVVWNSAGVITNLGLPEGIDEAQPTGISADGSVIGLTLRWGGPIAGAWIAGVGTVNLNTYLPTIGVDLSHWVLSRTYGVSADGRTIVGEGAHIDEMGVSRGDVFVVTLPCLAAPTIAVQPPATSVCPAGGESATITVVGGGAGINAYRWQWQPEGAGGVWVDLAEGVNTAGGVAALLASNKDTATLTVAPLAGNGETARPLRCVVGNPCGSVASNPALLTVIHRCGAADIGSQGGVSSSCGDGRLDNNDFIVFIDRFFAGDASADVGQQGGVPGADGLYDNNDFIVYIDLFFSAGGMGGC